MTMIKKQIAVKGGAEIYFEICGRGDPLLLLHGNGEDRRYFEHQVPTFAAHFQVIALDTRGHGRSTAGNLPWDFDLFAADVVAVLNALSLGSAHLLGFSDGGNTALQVALTYPDRVDKLILNGANLNPRGLQWQTRAAAVLSYAFCSLGALFAAKAARQKRYLDLMVHHPQLRATALTDVSSPTLVIAGSRDMIKDVHTKKIGAGIPLAETVIVAGGDHFVARKKPDAFNEIVLSFLSKSK